MKPKPTSGYSKEVARRILASLEAGSSFEVAFLAEGVDPRGLTSWIIRSKHPREDAKEFLEKCNAILMARSLERTGDN